MRVGRPKYDSIKPDPGRGMSVFINSGVVFIMGPDSTHTQPIRVCGLRDFRAKVSLSSAR